MSLPIKILLVDDVEQNLVALEALIARPGLETLRAYSGAQALELLLKHEVALALVDVQMPDMDGFELAELMRGSARTRNVPIIFLTATDRNALRTFRGYEAGAVDFLYKPYDPHILRSKVEVFVQLHSQKLMLADQLETLRQMMKTNEMFVAVLSHDLRNPLSSVLSSAELLMRLGGDERVGVAASRIRTSGTRMARMIDQLLDIARMRSGQLGLTLEAADFAAVCENIIAEFHTGDGPGRVSLHRAGETVGDWDVDRLAQVLSNLVGNALQHGATDAPVCVRVDGTHAEALSVTVENDGTIPAGVVERMFTPFHSESFQREQQASRDAHGLGLGLYIANELVKLHHGQLEVSSSDAQGTVFRMILPKRAGARGERLALSQSPANSQ